MVRRPKKQPVTYVRRPRQKRKGEIFDLLTGLVLLLSLCVGGWIVYLFNFPTTQLNPLPPRNLPTLPATIALPRPSQTLPATETQLPDTPQPVETTPTSADTPETAFTTITLPGPTATLADVPGGQTETVMPKTYYSYAVIGVPPVTAIQASTLNPSRSCSWMGVWGNVFDIQNRPATGILVQMGGYLNRVNYLQTSLSGTALQYGQAGYEFTLTKKPAASKNGLWVRLVDQSMQPISQTIHFDTYDDCAHNLILVNFKQVK